MHSSPISGFDLTQNLSLGCTGKYLLQLLLAPICQSFFFNTTRANHHVDLVSHPVSPRNHSFCVSYSPFPVSQKICMVTLEESCVVQICQGL
jgi:hypothetical protein